MPTLEEKRARAKKAGIPMPITEVPLNEGGTAHVPVTAQNSDMHSRLQALKSGAKRGDMSNLVNAKKNGAGPGGFQGIPEPKMKKNPNNPNNSVSDPSYKINPDAGLPPKPKSSGNSELDAIDAMFGGGGGGSYSTPTYNPNAANTSQPDLSVDDNGYVPEFNPQRMMAEKRSKMQNDSEYLQYASKASANQMANVMGDQQTQGQPNFDFNNMKKMMEQIARNTISDVLDSYTEKTKGKLTYENYTKTKDGYQVVKGQDGKFYKMVPVKIKKS